MQRLKKFKCRRCGCLEMKTGGSVNHHCAPCRDAQKMPNLSAPKYLAHQAVARARRSGQLADPRTLNCEDCGRPSVEYDHRDYSKPLDVAAVCRRCNLRRGPAAIPPELTHPTKEAADA